MMLMDTVDDRRRAMRESSNATFVQREEFCNLLLSTRRMIRSDEPALRVRGLLDMDTGTRFLIEQEKLFAK
jgi:hypothetical protein